MSRSQHAVELFQNGSNCAQSVLRAFSAELGLPEETAQRIACGFGGGMCRGEVCGAVTGALMVLGLRFGPRDAADSAAKEETCRLVEEFTGAFEGRCGSLICRELRDGEAPTAEEPETANTQGVFEDCCAGYVHTAAEMLEGMC